VPSLRIHPISDLAFIGGIGRLVFGGPESTGVAVLSAVLCGVQELMKLASPITTETTSSFDNSIKIESVRSAEAVKVKHSTLTGALGHNRSWNQIRHPDRLRGAHTVSRAKPTSMSLQRGH
jgi:hypothetical protein